MPSRNLDLIVAALTRLGREGVTFSSRPRLCDRLATELDVSERTIRRALNSPELSGELSGLVSKLLTGQEPPLPGETPISPPESVRPDVRHSVHPEPPPDRPDTAEHETPGHSPSTGAASRAHAPGRSPATPTAPSTAAAPPAAPPPAPPSPPSPDSADGEFSDDGTRKTFKQWKRRVKAEKNKYPKSCIWCGDWVEAGEGMLWVPFGNRPAPVHCMECWEMFDHVDRSITTPDGEPIPEPSDPTRPEEPTP